MGNHFHLLVKMLPESDFSDDDIKKRCQGFYGEDYVFPEGHLSHFRIKLASPSEFVRDIKVNFSRYYNYIWYRPKCVPGCCQNRDLKVIKDKAVDRRCRFFGLVVPSCGAVALTKFRIPSKPALRHLYLFSFYPREPDCCNSRSSGPSARRGWGCG